MNPDLAAQIVNDIQNEPGAPLLTQLALKDLFDVQQSRRSVITLTQTNLVEDGRRKVLQCRADAAFPQLMESEQQVVP
jgi:hypothetical protein